MEKKRACGLPPLLLLLQAGQWQSALSTVWIVELRFEYDQRPMPKIQCKAYESFGPERGSELRKHGLFPV
jgi:hypothetical protein